MSGVSRAEAWLLATAGLVLGCGVLSVPFLDDGSAPPSSGAAPSPVPSPTRSAVPLTVSEVRITTYSRGSHQLAVRALVSTGTSAALHVGARSYPLRLVDREVTGTVPITCGPPVPELQLVVRTGAGPVLIQSLGRPTAAVAEACAAPLPGTPAPTASPRGS
ncbi:MAG: hypothetical protein ABR549_08750 [Mycobacteriales bacterium]